MAYRPNPRGWEQIANGPEMTRVVTLAATRGKSYAESISPESNDGRGVPYKEQFDVEVFTDTTTGRAGSSRVGGRLINKAGHAAAVEWGNRANGGTGQRVLGRTLGALGGLGD